jgi:putative tryptophan/tyrosine transport system substrate-binding protein
LRKDSDPMIRGFRLFAVVLIFASQNAILGTDFSRAAEPAQKLVRVGFVSPFSASTVTHGVTAFWDRLRELGYVEGQNLIIETRWADGRYNRLPALMAEVMGRKVEVLVTYGTPAVIAAKRTTSTVPIVVAVMGDPVGSGVAASLAHPGGNLTGLSQGWDEGIGGKWLELLQETVPGLSTVAVVANPDNPLAQELARKLAAIAPVRALRLRLIEVRSPAALTGAFERAGRTAQAVLVLPDPVMTASRDQVTALAAKHRLPAMYTVRDFVDVGGLMAYTPDTVVMFRRAADYVDRILKGAKPGDLPMEQPTQYELVVNLKTAKALGITIPESILLRADEVIR